MLLEAVQAFVNQHGLSDRIHLIGRLDYTALQDWYNSADFIISSSFYEGSGIAVCEALSCGCIPIVTDIPSFRMMTGNGALGLLFEAGNSDSLLNMLHRSLMLDIPAERSRVLRHFESELSFDANARKIIQVTGEVQGS
jgi:glycosyltransferase involved in cell wall biosynthesis